MRSSFDIPDALFRQLKQRAAREGVPMKAVVLRALRDYLGGAKSQPFSFRWRTERGVQLVPDNILHSRVLLNEYLERPE